MWKNQKNRMMVNYKEKLGIIILKCQDSSEGMNSFQFFDLGGSYSLFHLNINLIRCTPFLFS